MRGKSALFEMFVSHKENQEDLKEAQAIDTTWRALQDSNLRPTA